MVRGKSAVQPGSRLIGYARVSTEDQSLSLQTDALLAAGVLPDNLHVEKKSGAKRLRASLELALKDCREGDTLVVWNLDRLTRSTYHLYQALERLEAKHVGFRSLTEAIDTTTPAGRLILGVLAVIAQFARELIAQRTTAGIQAIKAKRAKGEKWAWGRKTFMTPARIARVGKLLNGKKKMSGPAVAAKLSVSTASIYAFWMKNPKKGGKRFVRRPQPK